MDTTSVRYVNADAADKFAGFDLKCSKLPRADGPWPESLPPGCRASIRTDRVPTVLAVTGYLPPESLPRLSPCRPTARKYATAMSCANLRRGTAHARVWERAWTPTGDPWAD